MRQAVVPASGESGIIVTMDTLSITADRCTDPAHDALQLAMDTLAAQGGGTLQIGAGVYERRCALQLRSGVDIVAEPGAVIRKTPSVETKLANFVGYGFREFMVEEPDKLAVGMGVHLYDNNAGGFYTTVANIIERHGDVFYLDRMCNHDYLPHADARVVTLFPLVEGVNVHDVTIRGLTIDGNPKETRRLNGCRGGGVFLIGSSSVVIEDVEVLHYQGDAISFQQCHDIAVRRCHLHHNAGSGLHPGSGSVRYVFEDNDVQQNGGCGLFYCLRTTHGICRRNRFMHNTLEGISIGERDSYHLIENNTVQHNGGEGVRFRVDAVHRGNHVVVRDNDIGPNCATDATHEIVCGKLLRDVHVLNNRIQPIEGKGVLMVEPQCAELFVIGNVISDRPQQTSDIEGDTAAVSTTPAARLPDVGPAALSLDGARHIGVRTLEPWREL